MWSTRLTSTDPNGFELRRTAPPRPARSLFPQVTGLAGPDWQSKGQGFESPQLHSCGDLIPWRILAGQVRYPVRLRLGPPRWVVAFVVNDQLDFGQAHARTCGHDRLTAATRCAEVRSPR